MEDSNSSADEADEAESNITPSHSEGAGTLTSISRITSAGT